MATFTPPTTPGIPTSTDKNDIANRHWRYFEAWDMGKTVWRDQLGAWHEQIYPYQGGDTHTVHDTVTNTTTVTTDTSVQSLANAQVVYEGGHVYELTVQEEADLVAAGYGDRINLEPVTLAWEPSDLTHLSRRIISADLPNVSQVEVVANQGVFTLADGDAEGQSGLREFWLHDNTSGWTDVDVFCHGMDPPHFGTNYQGSGLDILPQSGVVLRTLFDGSKWRGITLNNNVIFGLMGLNIGVWEANEDGTGFANRQFGWNIFESYNFPYGFRASLVDNIVTVSIFQRHGTIHEWDPTKTKVIDLDTDAGDSGLIPTPEGEGTCGVIAAHLGTSPLSQVRLDRIDFERLS